MRKHVKNNVSWVGYLDWELETFHGEDYAIKHGSSQNAYLIEEEKTVLVDTIWRPHRFEFIDNLKKEIDLNKIDYVVCNHGEVDHSGALTSLMKEIPDTPIYCTENCVKSLVGQYGDRGWNFHTVKTGDTLDIGNGKKLIFIEMKMLHWPDSMATYLTGDNILFSMDAFGQHFAVEELFNDEADQCQLMHEAMKYYANILNPFSPICKKKLEEIDKLVEELGLKFDLIAPSHGVIWRDNPGQIIDLYKAWSDNYQEDQVTIAYDTMWEGTTRLAREIASEINKQHPETVVKVFNIAKTDKNEIMTEVFRSKAVLVGSPTESNDILASVAGWLTFLHGLRFKDKKAGAFGCYGWSGESVDILKTKLAEAGFDVVDAHVKCNWNPMTNEVYDQIPVLVEALLGESNTGSVEEEKEKTMDKYKCPCGYVYDPEKGDPDAGVQPGTAFEDLPEDWVCPVCGLSKDMFVKVD
ncbi:MAG: rubredoxin [Eggerthellaceae bacterium]|nr:rubredoxin [Eggerthellaceae bacterium]